MRLRVAKAVSWVKEPMQPSLTRMFWGLTDWIDRTKQNT